MSNRQRAGSQQGSGKRGGQARQSPQPAQQKQAPSSSRVGPGITRREEREKRLQERRHVAARQAQIDKLKRRGLWGGGILAGLLIVFLVVHVISSGATGSAGKVSVGNIPGVVTYSNLARTHVSGPVTYAQNPPVGGPHNPVWLNCGIYGAPVANENAVHSMEHGAVWITYQPTLATGAVQHLISLVKGHSYVILSPYPGLPAPVVASAWGVQLKLQTASDSRIAQFIKKYEQGPQTPEPGAPCSGGTGSPIQ
jgi:Protein of unknown function (DUF3105)